MNCKNESQRTLCCQSDLIVFNFLNGYFYSVRLIDFNGMTNHVGLFHTKRLGNWVHCLYLHFLCCYFSRFFAHRYMISIIPDTINLCKVVWLQVILMFYTQLYGFMHSNQIQIICTQSDIKYSYLVLILLMIINHLNSYKSSSIPIWFQATKNNPL